MAGINKATILGRVGKDPETRFTGSGKAVTSLSIATSRGKGDAEVTEWHNIVAWEKSAEIIGEHVKKGDLLYVEGQLQTRKWQDKDGNDRYTTEIVVRDFMLIGKTERRASSDEAPAASKPSKATAQSGGGSIGEMDDDIPF
jgi:single-strand DNA-binding protein